MQKLGIIFIIIVNDYNSYNVKEVNKASENYLQ